MLNWWTYGTWKHHLLASFALAWYVTKGIKMLTYANVLSAADLFLSSFLCSWGKIKDYENQFMHRLLTHHIFRMDLFRLVIFTYPNTCIN